MYCKVGGASIKNSPDVWRLIEARTGLERMRPIDQKLKYQVEKLVKAETGLAPDDPLRLRPNPDALVSKLDGEESGESDADDEDKASKVYKPPRIAAMHYDADLSAGEKQQAATAKQQKRVANSSVLRELREEASDRPAEIVEGRDTGHSHRRAAASERDRRQYEEDYFTRQQLTKAERHKQRQLATQGGLGGLASFGDVFGEKKGDESGAKKRKKASGKKGGKGKK